MKNIFAKISLIATAVALICGIIIICDIMTAPLNKYFYPQRRVVWIELVFIFLSLFSLVFSLISLKRKEPKTENKVAKKWSFINGKLSKISLIVMLVGMVFLIVSFFLKDEFGFVASFLFGETYVMLYFKDIASIIIGIISIGFVLYGVSLIRNFIDNKLLKTSLILTSIGIVFFIFAIISDKNYYAHRIFGDNCGFNSYDMSGIPYIISIVILSIALGLFVLSLIWDIATDKLTKICSILTVSGGALMIVWGSICGTFRWYPFAADIIFIVSFPLIIIGTIFLLISLKNKPRNLSLYAILSCIIVIVLFCGGKNYLFELRHKQIGKEKRVPALNEMINNLMAEPEINAKKIEILKKRIEYWENCSVLFNNYKQYSEDYPYSIELPAEEAEPQPEPLVEEQLNLNNNE